MNPFRFVSILKNCCIVRLVLVTLMSVLYLSMCTANWLHLCLIYQMMCVNKNGEQCQLICCLLTKYTCDLVTSAAHVTLLITALLRCPCYCSPKIVQIRAIIMTHHPLYCPLQNGILLNKFTLRDLCF